MEGSYKFNTSNYGNCKNAKILCWFMVNISHHWVNAHETETVMKLNIFSANKYELQFYNLLIKMLKTRDNIQKRELDVRIIIGICQVFGSIYCQVQHSIASFILGYFSHTVVPPSEIMTSSSESWTQPTVYWLNKSWNVNICPENMKFLERCLIVLIC